MVAVVATVAMVVVAVAVVIVVMVVYCNEYIYIWNLNFLEDCHLIYD